MSEPLTPDQEAIGLVEHARYIAQCLYLEEIPDDADFNCRDIYDRLAPVADLIRTLAARNAELTDALAKTEHVMMIMLSEIKANDGPRSAWERGRELMCQRSLVPDEWKPII